MNNILYIDVMINFTELFANAADNSSTLEILPPNINLGENGCPEYTLDGMADIRLGIFSKFVRNIPTESIDELVEKAINQIENLESSNQKFEYTRDLFVLLFEKRDCRGGEGEKRIFEHYFWSLASHYPAHCLEMISLIPEYGCWKDMFELINYIRVYNKDFKLQTKSRLDIISELDSDLDSDSGSDSYTKWVNNNPKPLINSKIQTLNVSEQIISLVYDKILNVIVNKWEEELQLEEEQDENKPFSPSLFWKWLPSERGEFAKKNYKFWRKILSSVKCDCVSYRITLSRMRANLEIPEIHMCNNTWAEIVPEKTPSVCANKNRKGFLNILCDQPNLTSSQEQTGNRYPYREDRVLTRALWLAAAKNGKIKGSQLSPDVMVIAMEKAITSESHDEIEFLNSQWGDLVRRTRARIEKAKMEGYAPMDNVIPMIDLSGSMNGTPEKAAIGLGIMLSQLNSGTCSGLVITFATDCKIIDLSGASTFSEKIKLVRSLPVGYTTNFHLAMRRICELILKHKLPQESIPDLCILSDEQFNHPQFHDKSGSSFRYTNLPMESVISQMFIDVGVQVSGTPYTKPRTIHWNLRGNTKGYPAKADDLNVQMVAGYNPALFDLILCGIPEPTPYQTMRRKIDHERYQLVRDAFSLGF